MSENMAQNLPEEFIAQMESLLGKSELVAFLESLRTQAPVSIRLHPLKNSAFASVEDKVAWCPLGRYLNERPVFTLDPDYHSGAYYVQEAASMCIWQAMEQMIQNTDDVKILDLCAAPGGKSSLIAAYLKGQGLLVSNEVIKSRSQILRQNIVREGWSNIIATCNDPADFKVLGSYFDVVFVDAPCSGEGMFRKDKNAIGHWSIDAVQQCTMRQKRILSDIFPVVKPGGYIVYSTCTFNEEENIRQVSWMTKAHALKSIPMDISHFSGIIPMYLDECIGYQFLPHRTRSEGFFISILQKGNEEQSSSNIKPKKTIMRATKEEQSYFKSWNINKLNGIYKNHLSKLMFFPEKYVADAEKMLSSHYVIHCGLEIGAIKGIDLVPSHELAYFPETKNFFNVWQVSKGEALKFLKKDISDTSNLTPGWQLVCYGGNGIGWIKNIGTRLNNYLPQEYAIRMSLNNLGADF